MYLLGKRCDGALHLLRVSQMSTTMLWGRSASSFRLDYISPVLKVDFLSAPQVEKTFFFKPGKLACYSEDPLFCL
jgi:hypothetical protein